MRGHGEFRCSASEPTSRGMKKGNAPYAGGRRGSPVFSRKYQAAALFQIDIAFKMRWQFSAGGPRERRGGRGGRRTGGCRRKKTCRRGAGGRPQKQPAEGAEPGSMGAGRDDARPFPRPSEKRGDLKSPHSRGRRKNAACQLVSLSRRTHDFSTAWISASSLPSLRISG